MLTRPERAHQNVFHQGRRLKPKIDKMMNISAAYIIRTFESDALEYRFSSQTKMFLRLIMMSSDHH